MSFPTGFLTRETGLQHTWRRPRAGSRFDGAIARFSAAYADQNERDYGQLTEAVSAGEVTALSGI